MDLPFSEFGIGIGIGAVVLAIVVYVALFLIMLWIAYLIVRAAVTSGIMRAAKRGAFQSMAPPLPAQHNVPQQFPRQQPFGGPGQPLS